MSERILPHVAPDAALPHLASLTLRCLQRAMAAEIPAKLLGAPAASYSVSNLRYKPGEKLVLGLTSAQGRPVAIRVFPGAKVLERFARAQRETATLTFHLAGLDSVAWVFPAERKLRLEIVADRARLAAVARAVRGFELVGMELVHYVPEHTYTARVLGRTTTGLITEYLKVYYNDAGARAAAICGELAPQARAAGLEIPSDCAYVPSERLLFQAALQRDPQRRLGDHEAARALARFHGMNAAAAPLAEDDTADALAATVRLCAATFPEHERRVEALCTSLAVQHARQGEGTRVLLHGDPHLGNLLPLGHGSTGFIDLDAVRYAPAENDLASYFAFKLWLCVRERSSPAALLNRFADFITAYNADAARPVERGRAWLRLAATMVTERVKRGIVRGKLHHAGELLEFVRLAEESMERSCHA